MQKPQMDVDNFEPVARIVVIGVGGAGSNAVNAMMDENIDNVEFYVLNTDRQALATSKAPNRIPIGETVTMGLGAGGDPEKGRKAAESSAETIRDIVRGANMVFIAAGMGGGTGTGAAPVVAAISKEEGALTVAIVTRPFTFEGNTRIAHSVTGLGELRDAVDSIIIVSNDKLLMNSGNVAISSAFSESDRVLAQSVKTVVDLILLPAIINLDFADVEATLRGAGISLIGFGQGSGPNKAMQAAELAINSPLLEASIAGARRAICSVTCGPMVTLYEAQECVKRITEAAGTNIDVKFGVSINEELEDNLLVSVIAADFPPEYDFTATPQYSLPHSNPVSTLSQSSLDEDEHEQQSEGETSIQDTILPDFLRE